MTAPRAGEDTGAAGMGTQSPGPGARLQGALLPPRLPNKATPGAPLETWKRGIKQDRIEGEVN